MARRCWFKGNKRWMNWSWNAQKYQREDKKALRRTRKVRRTEETEEKEEVLIQEDTPEDENGRKKKTIKKIEKNWG